MSACADDFECRVWVCRSLLDRKVWFTYADDHDDLTDFEHPGTLRAVQRYAAGKYGDHRPAQWKAVNPDTWELHRYPCLCEADGGEPAPAPDR